MMSLLIWREQYVIWRNLNPRRRSDKVTKFGLKTPINSEISPSDVATIQSLGPQLAALNKEKTELEAQAFKNQDRIVALKGVIHADLQGHLRGCVEATAPANKLVNITIQALAILSTGGASLALPPKALYVDMSAVLNGYPTGSEHSVINEAREAALRALPGGLGNPGNDFGKIVRDPGRLIRCPFGGC